MALPSSGSISMSQVNVELGKSSTATISLNDTAVRTLFGKASGAISLADGYGKSSEVRFVNSVNRTAASIFELMGSPTTADIYVFENNATISAGTGTYALRTGVFPAGSTLTILNKGTIQGRGGNGGNATWNSSSAGSAGSSALYVDYPCTIDNAAGFILGGGGGGGAGHYPGNEGSAPSWCGGGGGQGSNGGAAGTGRGTNSVTVQTAGTASAGGSHGRGSGEGDWVQSGAGGAAGAAGGGATSSTTAATRRAGGAGGAAITRNGNTVTITAGNDTTRIKGAVA